MNVLVNDPLAPGALRKNGERMPQFEGTFLFKNDFPVMNSPAEKEELAESDDLFVTQSCQGVSHVLVYHPEYKKHFAQMSSSELNAVFTSWSKFFSENRREFEYIQAYCMPENV